MKLQAITTTFAIGLTDPRGMMERIIIIFIHIGYLSFVYGFIWLHYECVPVVSTQ